MQKLVQYAIDKDFLYLKIAPVNPVIIFCDFKELIHNLSCMKAICHVYVFYIKKNTAIELTDIDLRQLYGYRKAIQLNEAMNVVMNLADLLEYVPNTKELIYVSAFFEPYTFEHSSRASAIDYWSYISVIKSVDNRLHKEEPLIIKEAACQSTTISAPSATV